jgi:two-component system, cell cycle sensor histidine kinase and response regulator CckA
MVQNKIANDSLKEQKPIISVKPSFSESFIEEALQLSQEGFWTYYFHDDRFVITQEIYSILELTHDTDLSNIRAITQMLLPAEKNKLHNILLQIANQVNHFDFTLKVNLPDDSNKFLAVRAKLTRNEHQNPVQMIGTFRDITDEYYHIQQLRENEALYRSLFNHLTDIFIIFELVHDDRGNVTDYLYKEVNPVFEMKFDLPKKEIINKCLSQQVQLFQQFHPLLKITAITGEPHQNSLFIQSIDCFVDVLIYSPGENLVATIWRDVSMMVEANSSLQENEEKYRQIFSIGKDGLFMIDFFSGKILDVNPAATHMYGYSKETLLKKAFRDLFTDTDELEKVIQDQKANQYSGTSYNEKGQHFPAEIALSYFNWSGRKVVVASVRDTSDRVLAQIEIVKSEKKFKHLFDFSNDAILILKDYKIAEFNLKSQQIFNIPASEMHNNNLWNLSPQQQPNGDHSRMKMLDFIQQAMQGNQLHFDWVFEKPDRSIFFADLKMSPILLGDEKIIQVIVRDVSPRKINEEALILKENRWKHSLEISATGVWEWNIITNEVYFSRVWASLIGYEKEELITNFETYEKHLHPDDLDLVFNSFESYFSARSKLFAVNFRFRCRNGSYKWMHGKGKILSYTAEGKPEKFMGTHTDITFYKLNEINLIETREKYKSAAEWIHMGYWELNLKNLIVTAPEQTMLLFGINSRQATLKQIESMVHPEDQKKFASQFLPTRLSKKQESTFRIIINNETRFIVSVAIPLYNQLNTLIGFEGVFQDVSKLKKNEQQLKDDQKLIKSYLNKTRQAILTMQDDQVVFLNNRFSEITGFQPEDLINSKFQLIDQVVPEDKPLVQDYFNRLRSKSSLSDSLIFRFESKSNRIKWIELNATVTELKGREAYFYILEDINDRKRSEQLILNELSQKNELIDYAPMAFAIVDPDGSLPYFNIEFANFTGLQQINGVKNILSDFFKSTDFNIISGNIDKFRKGKTTEFVTELELKNGQYCYLKIHPIFYKDRTDLKYLLVYLKNIDIIRKQNELLTTENQLHASMFRNLTVAIGLFDANQRLLKYNQKLPELFVLNEGEMNFSFSDFVELQPRLDELFSAAIETCETQKIIFNISEEKYYAVTLTPFELDSSWMVMMYAADISNDYLRNHSIASQLNRYESIFNNAPTGIALLDKNRNIVTCNDQYASLLNFKMKEQQDIKLDELIQTEYLSAIINNFSELFANVKSSFNQVLQMNGTKGEKQWLQSNFQQLLDQYREVAYVIHTIDDVSRIKEEEYNNINTERMKTLSYLANSFAHEFNNHLMAMYGNSFLLKSNLTDPVLGKYADALFETITKSSELTHSLLSFSKNNSKINVLINLPQLIEQLIIQMDLPQNLEYKASFDRKFEFVFGDSSLLQRALLNMIENSKDSMPHGGTLFVETKAVYFEEKDDPMQPDQGKYIRIRIADTGSGIKKTDLSKIFDPFYTTKTNLQNAGLGLTVARKIIQEHGGMIKATSTNKGTEMLIYLPQPAEEIIRNSIQPDEQLIIKGSANLMIVDDEDVVRIVTGELLKKLGYNVFSFASPDRALKFYRENFENIDLVVLDKFMPEMDGSEVYFRLKTINPQLKLVLLTGYNIDHDLLDKFEGKNNQIIQKPAGIEKLSQAISALLLTSKG